MDRRLVNSLGKRATTDQAEQPREPITITLPDGKQVEGKSWETTPYDIARGISSSLADRIIIAKVNNQELWDLTRPLEASCSLALLDFDSPDNNYEARQVFWHSSAHVLGEACERRYEGCCLGYGPPLEEGGFFYDMSLADQRTISVEDYPKIEEVARKAVKEKQPFERLELPKEVLLEMFKVCLGSPLPVPRSSKVQQVQAILHQRQGSGRHKDDSLPLWTLDRPLSRPARTPHGSHQVVSRDKGQLGESFQLS